MNKLWTVLAVGSLFAVSALAETLSGTISDANCGAKHAAASASDAACVKSCLKRGAEPVFVSDGKVYKVAADTREKVMPLAGMKVTIDGKIEGDTVTIASAQAAEE